MSKKAISSNYYGHLVLNSKTTLIKVAWFSVSWLHGNLVKSNSAFHIIFFRCKCDAKKWNVYFSYLAWLVCLKLYRLYLEISCDICDRHTAFLQCESCWIPKTTLIKVAWFSVSCLHGNLVKSNSAFHIIFFRCKCDAKKWNVYFSYLAWLVCLKLYRLYLEISCDICDRHTAFLQCESFRGWW